MCTVNEVVGRPFEPDGCQVPIGGGVCGETKSLHIINEFKRLYEEKLQQIDAGADGDHLQEKIKLQQEWIGNLTEQNEMLVRAVEELEYEATERVQMLEDKLQKSAKCICEVMKKYLEHDVTNDLLQEPLQKLFYLENDQKNLLEFIRRVRENNEWCMDGLTFYDVTPKDVLGANNFQQANTVDYSKMDTDIHNDKQDEQKIGDQESKIRELQGRIDHYSSFGDVESIVQELKCKKDECESLKQSMVDMRQALTEEVAAKHDNILSLKRDCLQLEERCQISDKQIVFKDDIIKELRKEIKQLKQQNCACHESANEALKTKLNQLESLSTTFSEEKSELEGLENKFNKFMRDKADLKLKCKSYEKSCKQMSNELESLKSENKKLACIKECLESDAVKVSGEIQQLTDDKNEAINHIFNLNNENRDLSKTIDGLRKRIDRTSTCTQDEVCKLNKTIDELQNNLQQSKMLQEQEVLNYQQAISDLNATISEMDGHLQEARRKYEKDAKVCKICKGRSKVGFTDSPDVCIENVEEMSQLEKQLVTISNKEETIQIQSDTLNIIKLELQAMREKDAELQAERERRCQENQQLQDRIVELENALQDSQGRANNLQMAVDLYLNSMNVLEASEEKAKVEIEQQKLTIANLQQALVACKQELDELRQKTEENIYEQNGTISILYAVLLDVEMQRRNIYDYFQSLSEEYKRLQDLNYELEMEHCDKLQDMEILESQFSKYKALLRKSEEENSMLHNTVKKISKQKKCFEEVIAYFKEEMKLLADQLYNLQELLTLSNESAQEESSKLMEAFMNVQMFNKKLSSQLLATEEKVHMENQMNQMQEAKIHELQSMISEKDLDLIKHDEAIVNIRQTLQCSLQQNEELHSTVIDLNGTIVQLQHAVKSYETDNSRTKENTQFCKAQINACKEKLADLKSNLNGKTAELVKLEMAYNRQSKTLQLAQNEIHELRENDQAKKCHLRCTINEIKEKLVNMENKHCYLNHEYIRLQKQLDTVCRREAIKDLEVKRYRKIVSDLKNTMVELNKNLTNKEFTNDCPNEECKRNMQLIEEVSNEDVCVNCPCEIVFYQNIVEALRKSVIELKKKLNDSQLKYQKLDEESRKKEAKLAELSTSQVLRDQEYNELRHQFMEKLQKAHLEEKRYSELTTQFEHELVQIRQELQVKSAQLNDAKRSVQEINSSRCIQLAVAQQEINSFKCDLNRLLKKHCALNQEYEKVHLRSARMQTTVSTLEERNQLLKEQLEQYIGELQHRQIENETLVRKNKELLTELRAIQCSYGAINRQQRYTSDSVKNLEAELDDVRNNRDEICNESKNVVSYVRAWLQEQKKINEHVARKERDYCDTIRKLRQENEELTCQNRTKSQSSVRRQGSRSKATSPPTPPPTCQSPWSLGSQGTASVHDIDSPCRSPCSNSDWYSPTFRNESEDDDDYDEDWVSKVEHLAAQVRRTNQKWKNKMGNCEFMVSRDTKK